MTLQEAENDQRFDNFKFMSMIDLVMFIMNCNARLVLVPNDKQMTEYRDAAKLIKDARIKTP